MKKLIFLLICLTFILCGCSYNGDEQEKILEEEIIGTEELKNEIGQKCIDYYRESFFNGDEKVYCMVYLEGNNRYFLDVLDVSKEKECFCGHKKYTYEQVNEDINDKIYKKVDKEVILSKKDDEFSDEFSYDFMVNIIKILKYNDYEDIEYFYIKQ